MFLKRFLISWLVLITVWMLLSSSFDLVNILVGVGVSLIIALFYGSKTKVFGELNINIKSFLYIIIYFFVFVIELLKSNLDVARRVLSPSLPIKPGIVKVKTKLKSKTGRMILANSITLTPGTLTIDIREDVLYIHWIDVRNCDQDCATEEIVRKFEKYLEVIYG